jgi:hypothetical protein
MHQDPPPHYSSTQDSKLIRYTIAGLIVVLSVMNFVMN